MAGLFISATGTGVGKTYITTHCIKSFSTPQVQALKPITSGWQPEKTDTHKLIAAMGKDATLEQIDEVSPFRFQAPLSPDQAAPHENASLDYLSLIQFCQNKINVFNRLYLIEGVGGVRVPLSETKTVIDWVADLNLPMLLVAGTYLGCLSHTLTALDACRAKNIFVAGIVVNESYEQNTGLEPTLKSLRPFCGTIPLIAWHYGQTQIPEALYALIKQSQEAVA